MVVEGGEVEGVGEGVWSPEWTRDGSHREPHPLMTLLVRSQLT